MLRILDAAAYQQVIELARQHGCFMPPGAVADDREYLAPILEFLDSFAGDEFRSSCRAVLAPGSCPGELLVHIEFLQADRQWTSTLQGRLFFSPGPPASFHLHFHSQASSAA